MDDGKTEAGWYLCSFAVLGVNWNEPPICISFHAFEFVKFGTVVGMYVGSYSSKN